MILRSLDLSKNIKTIWYKVIPNAVSVLVNVSIIIMNGILMIMASINKTSLIKEWPYDR